MSTTAAPILVTGASGMVGARICLDLLLQGRPVAGLRRSNSSMEILERTFANHRELLQRITWKTGDVTDVTSVYEALEDVQEVYHAAGLVSFDPLDRDRLQLINEYGTANVVNMALEHGVNRFCHISSVAALGRTGDEPFVTETATWKNSSYNSSYAISKYGAEREVWRGVEEGLKAVIVNPTVILGPANWNSGSGLLFRAVWEGLKFYPVGTTGFVDIGDVSKLAITLMEKEIFGERFIINAANISYFELFTTIAQALQRPAPSVKVSPSLAALAWRVERLRTLITGKAPVITRETAHTSSGSWSFDGGKVLRATGSSYRPIKDAVTEWSKVFLETGR